MAYGRTGYNSFVVKKVRKFLGHKRGTIIGMNVMRHAEYYKSPLGVFDGGLYKCTAICEANERPKYSFIKMSRYRFAGTDAKCPLEAILSP